MKQSLEFHTFMVFGAGGVLGQAVLSKMSAPMSAEYRMFPFDHSRADITDSEHIKPLMEYVRPSIVINCASVSDPDLCEEAQNGARLVNETGPAVLAQACKQFDAKLVHFSSASVFDGKKRSPYLESNKAAPVNECGRSKLAGERAIRKILPHNHLIIRPGMVFGLEGPSCVASWLGMADKKMEIGVLDNHYVSPTYAPDLVEATLELVLREATGVYHITNTGQATMEGLVKTTLGLAGLMDAPITKAPKDLQHFFKAPVPQNTMLYCKKYEKETKRPLRRWENALKHCLFFMRRYSPPK